MMKQTKISDMTPEQAMDELTFTSLKKLLQVARKAELKANAAHDAVFAALDDMGINLDVKSGAENADNLEDAICCFIHYGEYGVKNIIQEIRSQYGKETTADDQ